MNPYEHLPWRCFHCGSVFVEAKDAELHFGPQWYAPPLCQIDAKKFRETESMLEAYRLEDTVLHRQLGQLASELASAVRRAEEEGYARGLRDSVPAGMIYAVTAKDKREVYMLFDAQEKANAFVDELAKCPGYTNRFELGAVRDPKSPP